MSSVDGIFRFIEVGATKIQHDKNCVLIVGRFSDRCRRSFAVIV